MTFLSWLRSAVGGSKDWALFLAFLAVFVMHNEIGYDLPGKNTPKFLWKLYMLSKYSIWVNIYQIALIGAVGGTVFAQACPDYLVPVACLSWGIVCVIEIDRDCLKTSSVVCGSLVGYAYYKMKTK